MHIGNKATMTCSTRRKDGSPCTGRARPSGYCFAHDPELQERRAAGKRTGGAHKRTVHRLDRLTPASLKPVLNGLHTAVAVEDGGMEPCVGTALATLRALSSRLARLEARRGTGGTLTVRWHGPHEDGTRGTIHAETALAALERRVPGAVASCAVWVHEGYHVSVCPLHGSGRGARWRAGAARYTRCRC
jgi:hypothetical protein